MEFTATIYIITVNQALIFLNNALDSLLSFFLVPPFGSAIFHALHDHENREENQSERYPADQGSESNGTGNRETAAEAASTANFIELTPAFDPANSKQNRWCKYKDERSCQNYHKDPKYFAENRCYEITLEGVAKLTCTATEACLEMVRVRASIASTVVTELIFTEEAGHMVAALSFLNLCSTHWTKDDSICTITPTFECFLHCRFTRCEIAMPLLFATETDRAGALWTLKLPGIHILRNHVAITVW